MLIAETIGINRVVIVCILCVIRMETSDAKSWKDYDLTVGPKKGETSRYIYNASLGGQVHCHYCEAKALRDSSFSFLQQHLCIEKYRGKKIDEVVLPQERDSKKYPLCVKGEVPGCGPPPEVNKTKNLKWQCDPGYSNVFYSVYFSCALVCNITDRVHWSYYCNETLQWDTKQSIPWQSCEVPQKIKEQSQVLVIVVPVASFIVLSVILVLVGFRCYRRRKRARSAENLPENNVENQNNNHNPLNRNTIENPAPQNARPEVEPVSDVSEHSTGSIQSSSYQTTTSEEAEPLLPAATPRTRDTGTGPDVSYSEEEAGGSGPDESGSPDIRVMIIKDGESQNSVPLQGKYYNIEKGLDFAIIPNSSGGAIIKDFRIERKGDGKRFRGNRSNFWYVVSGATEDDAGIFLWTMVLANRANCQGSFDIGISLPDIPTTAREAPVGQEDDDEPVPSVSNPVNPCLSQQQTDSASHLTYSSIFKAPESISSKKNLNNYIKNNNNKVPVHQSNQAYQVNIEAQIHPEITQNPSVFHNIPGLDLSSSMLRNQLGRNTDSGLKMGDTINSSSSRSRNMSPNQVDRMHENHDRNGVRPGNMTCSTSGYESQRSSEVARERFNEHFNGAPGLNPSSFVSSTPSSRNLSGLTAEEYLENYQHSNLGQEHNIQSDRTDPAGGTSQDRFTESRRSWNPDDPDQSRRKEVVESQWQQQQPECGNAAEDGDEDSISEALDNAEFQKTGHQSPDYGDNEGDTDSISDRLISVPLQRPDTGILPTTLDDNTEDCIVINEDILPRSETHNAREMFEIDPLTMRTNRSDSDDIEKQDETGL